jgi:hypothetical protein
MGYTRSIAYNVFGMQFDPNGYDAAIKGIKEYLRLLD